MIRSESRLYPRCKGGAVFVGASRARATPLHHESADGGGGVAKGAKGGWGFTAYPGRARTRPGIRPNRGDPLHPLHRCGERKGVHNVDT